MQVEAPKGKSKPGKSIYAKATDTGIDPETAAKRLNLDWDSAADIDGEEEEEDETEVPAAVVSYCLRNTPINLLYLWVQQTNSTTLTKCSYFNALLPRI